MNRLTPLTVEKTLAALDDNHASRPAYVIKPHMMASWTPDTFAQVLTISGDRRWFRSGLAIDTDDGWLQLALVNPPFDSPVAVQSLQIGTEKGQLLLTNAALDQLAGQLTPDTPVNGVGRTLSLDAIEAIMAGSFASLPTVALGRADWLADPNMSLDRPSLGLCMAGTPMPLTGDIALGLHCVMTRYNDTLTHVPSQVAEWPKHASVIADYIYGASRLSPSDLAGLTPGCGVTLDVFWPDGRTLIGQRFLQEPDTPNSWSVINSPTDSDMLFVRSKHAVCALDDIELSTTTLQEHPTHLELVRGETVVAKGVVRCAQLDGQSVALLHVGSVHVE